MAVKTRKDWLILAMSLAPGPLLGFSFAFDPGVCNPSFSELNFLGLIAFATVTSGAMLWCLKKAIWR